MSDNSQNTFKIKFEEKISASRLEASANSVFLTASKYQSLIEEVLNTRTLKSKTPRHFWLQKHYDVLTVQDKQKLIVPVKEASDILYYVTDEELFQILYDSHVSIGHGGRDRMVKEIRKKYKNITIADIQTFLEFCEPCQQKQKSQRKGIVVKPMVFTELNSRCQVDLIDFQSHPDGVFKFIMVYQDHLTKFVILNPLQRKTGENVATKLVDIFTLFGAPSVLQSDNGREFVNKIIDSLVLLWPELKIVHGEPRHSQSQGSVERANQDIENMLTTWMQENRTKNWSEGLRFIQFMKNRAYHSGIKRSPYEAMFGAQAKLGLTTSTIPEECLISIRDEEDLQYAIESIKIPNKSIHVLGRDTKNDERDVQQQESPSSPGSSNPARSEQLNSENKTCITCELPCDEECKCSTCLNFLHLSCGINGNEQSLLVCQICHNKESIVTEREEAHNALNMQAKKMLTISNQNFQSISIGSTVRIPVPDVDRGRGDARSILAVVLDVNDEDLYQLGTKNGIIDSLYARSQFSKCNENLVGISEVPQHRISLRTVASAQSTGTGQGFFKCSCQSTKSKCQTNKCRCYKGKVLCNSKCHSKSTCENK